MQTKTFYIVSEEVKSNCARFIQSLATDQDLTVTIQKKRQSRSLKQNNLLHKWLSIIRDERHLAGYKLYDIDTWKALFCQLFLEPETKEVEGVIVTNRKSTAKLTVSEFAEFLNKIEAYSITDMGIYLPNPQDLGADYAR